MLRQNPGDRETRWAAARAEHRVANILARSPRLRRGRAGFSSGPPEPDRPARTRPRDFWNTARKRPTSSPIGGRRNSRAGSEVKKLRRRALEEHLRLASEFPGEPKHARSVSRDCLEVAKSIGIVDPAEAVEKEALFRRAVALRKGLEDRSFEGKAELAEALAYLGHLLNATNRRGEGEQVMAEGSGAAWRAWSPNLRATRPVATGSSRWKTCSRCPAIANPRRGRTRRWRPTRRRLTARPSWWPNSRSSRSSGRRWPGASMPRRPRSRSFGRTAEAEAHERRSVAMFEELLRDHPSVDHYRRWAALAVEGLGVMLEGSDRLDEARSHFRRAIAILPEAHRMRARIARKLEAAAPPSPAINSPRSGDSG